MRKGVAMDEGKGKSALGIALGILIVEGLIGLAAIALADAEREHVHLGVWSLAWLTVPLLALAANRHPQKYGWFALAASVPHIVVGIVAGERVQAATSGPAPLAGLALFWASFMAVVFVITVGLASRWGEKARSS